MPLVMDNGSGHFIQIGLGQASLLRPTGVETFHDLNGEISPDLIGSGKIVTAVKAGGIGNIGQSSGDTAHGHIPGEIFYQKAVSKFFCRIKKLLVPSLSDGVSGSN
jgi:hypothetical protein